MSSFTSGAVNVVSDRNPLKDAFCATQKPIAPQQPSSQGASKARPIAFKRLNSDERVKLVVAFNKDRSAFDRKYTFSQISEIVNGFVGRQVGEYALRSFLKSINIRTIREDTGKPRVGCVVSGKGLQKVNDLLRRLCVTAASLSENLSTTHAEEFKSIEREIG
jgi:hypothetical protein